MVDAQSQPAGEHAQQLIIAENGVLARRSVAWMGDDVATLVGSDPRSHDLAGRRHELVVVAGFSAAPHELRSVVDIAFGLLAEHGEVRIGASDRPVDTTPHAWEQAFDGIAVELDADATAGPRLRLAPGATGGGVLLLGVLIGLSLEPQVELPTGAGVAEDELPSVPELTLGKSKKGKAGKKAATISAPGPAFLSRPQSILAVAGIVAACAVGAGLHALIGGYATTVLVTIVGARVVALGWRCEQHQRETRERLDALSNAAKTQRDDQHALVTALRPVNLNLRVSQVLRDLQQMQPSMAVDQLAAAESRRVVHSIEQLLRERSRADG